jgi:hypothetical protein
MVVHANEKAGVFSTGFLHLCSDPYAQRGGYKSLMKFYAKLLRPIHGVRQTEIKVLISSRRQIKTAFIQDEEIQSLYFRPQWHDD